MFCHCFSDGADGNQPSKKALKKEQKKAEKVAKKEQRQAQVNTTVNSLGFNLVNKWKVSFHQAFNMSIPVM
jgi:hypothetical protein